MKKKTDLGPPPLLTSTAVMGPVARIYKESSSPMQSGEAKKGRWVLEYEPVTARRPESLMGWTSSEDTLNQIRLYFSTQQEALDFVKQKGLSCVLITEHKKKIKPRNYSDNFRYPGAQESH